MPWIYTCMCRHTENSEIGSGFPVVLCIVPGNGWTIPSPLFTAWQDHLVSGVMAKPTQNVTRCSRVEGNCLPSVSLVAAVPLCVLSALKTSSARSTSYVLFQPCVILSASSHFKRGQRPEWIGNKRADREHVHPSAGIPPSLCHCIIFDYLFNGNRLIPAAKEEVCRISNVKCELSWWDFFPLEI